MIKEISLFDEINKGGFQTSLITTYNAYVPFYEEVVLRKLVSKGVHHNLVLMDKNQFLQSVKTAPPTLAGTFYSLFPMDSPGAFHPKILFLAGKKKGVLFIGSHNLTLSGYGYNREITNVIRYSEREPDEVSLNLIKSAWFQINEWLKNQSFPENIVGMIKKIEGFAPWLKGDVDVVGNGAFVLSSQPDKHSLLKQLIEKITGRVNRIILTGAFFDSELALLKELKNELDPEEIIVGIDPKSVSFPGERRNIEPVRFVNSSLLGTKKEDDQNNYLHAKSMLIEQDNGRVLLVTGSANPSKQAWLVDGLDSNTEMVLCRSDEFSMDEAETLGMLDIPDMEKIKDEEWQSISDNWSETVYKKNEDSSAKVGLAVASNEGIHFKIEAFDSDEPIQCELLNFEKATIGTLETEKYEKRYKIIADTALIKKTCWVQFIVNSDPYLYLVHHEKEIMDRSKTGTQRRLQEALSSISTDSPDIGVVIDCVSKIIFSADEDRSSSANKFLKKSSGREKSDEIDEGGSLSISLKDDPKYKRKKFRLNVSDDLGWLFNTLLYHLNADCLNIDVQDESIDDDDDEDGVKTDDDSVEKREREALTILEQCHNKIRLLVNRMRNQFHALKDEKVGLDDVILKLTGTLALLRHLRKCDGKLFWIPKGHTSFPKKMRKELLDGIIEVFFDGKFSLVFKNKINEKIFESDELARLKGLIVWLAWDAGIRLDTEEGFNEYIDDREKRLKNNGIMVHLAQLMGGDEVVKSEASKSIMLIEKNEPSWLKWINDADKKLRKLLDSVEAIDKIGKYNKPLKVGSIAIDKNNPAYGVRIIGRSGFSGIEVFDFLPKKKFKRLTPKNAICINFNTVMKNVG
jgi:phosphatidylserine/phosphatidylglycerophosphate/cardiolipin synthase-like enzyme